MLAATAAAWCAKGSLECGATTVSSAAIAFSENEDEERCLQASWLRDLFGPLPYRRLPSVAPAVLAWNDRTVLRIAQASYDMRNLPDRTLDPGPLSIMADALLDAGCDDEGLLAHLRDAGPHVRGCWAVDLILGKA
jgi:hypothetical protein